MGTKSYTRREAAADQIQLLLTSNPSVYISPLPIASYAASLSMTVAYRKPRDNQSLDDSPAYVRSLAYRCEILESFKERWWSAEAMARLGREALWNILELSKSRNHDQQPGSTAAKPTYNADFLNPLEMLSSVAESHAQVPFPNEPSQILTAAPESGDFLGADDLLLEVQDCIRDNVDAIHANEEFEPFRDLDTAFGDFFHLSMPTTFFDPLFEDIGGFNLA